MTLEGALFDFSGTLMRVEPAERWLSAVLNSAALTWTKEEIDRCAARLEEAGALPGGAPPRSIPPHLQQLWQDRDITPKWHRAAYTALARQIPLPDPELYDALYDRHTQPQAWLPYPDTAEVLRELREREVRIAVVSNIGWDLRPVFREHGLDPYVDAYVLSYEHGVKKPDPRLFRTACDGLGLGPADVLMVGDDRRADGGAAALGCAVHLVDHLPVDERPDGLRPVLRLVG